MDERPSSDYGNHLNVAGEVMCKLCRIQLARSVLCRIDQCSFCKRMKKLVVEIADLQKRGIGHNNIGQGKENDEIHRRFESASVG